MREINVIRGGRIKVGDSLPNLRVQLLEDGDPFNLSDYDVSMSMKKANEDFKKIDNNSSNITIEDEGRGIVSFKWERHHTNTRGTYLIEMMADEVSGSKQISFPNSGYELLFIEERL